MIRIILMVSLGSFLIDLSYAASVELSVNNTGINRINVVLNDNVAGNLLITAPDQTRHLSWKHVGWMCQSHTCPVTLRVDTTATGESQQRLSKTFFLNTLTGAFTPSTDKETVNGVFYAVYLTTASMYVSSQTVHEGH